MVRGPYLGGWLNLYGLNPPMPGLAWLEVGKLDDVALEGMSGVASRQVELRSLMRAARMV